MMTDPTRPIGTHPVWWFLCSPPPAARVLGPQPLNAKIENTTPRNRLEAKPQLPGVEWPETEAAGAGAREAPDREQGP